MGASKYVIAASASVGMVLLGLDAHDSPRNESETAATAGSVTPAALADGAAVRPVALRSAGDQDANLAQQRLNEQRALARSLSGLANAPSAAALARNSNSAATGNVLDKGERDEDEKAADEEKAASKSDSSKSNKNEESESSKDDESNKKSDKKSDKDDDDDKKKSESSKDDKKGERKKDEKKDEDKKKDDKKDKDKKKDDKKKDDKKDKDKGPSSASGSGSSANNGKGDGGKADSNQQGADSGKDKPDTKSEGGAAEKSDGQDTSLAEALPLIGDVLKNLPPDDKGDNGNGDDGNNPTPDTPLGLAPLPQSGGPVEA